MGKNQKSKITDWIHSGISVRSDHVLASECLSCFEMEYTYSLAGQDVCNPILSVLNP